jgi:hypothetical protein
VVPYEFDNNVMPANRAAMLIAMAQWQNCANVQFVPRSGEHYYVHIQSSDANNSSLGRVGGVIFGGQTINITNWDSTFIMAHELGHCLGFDHTQTRTDRSAYVTINYANIQPNFTDQFDVHVGFNDYGPYDFDSVMHYGQCSFSIDCQPGYGCINCAHHVIDVLPPNDAYWQSRIGQRTHLSTFDKLIMSFLYPQPSWVFVDCNYNGNSSSVTFLQPCRALSTAEVVATPGGTVWLQPGTYAATGTHSKAMTVKAPLGGVTLVGPPVAIKQGWWVQINLPRTESPFMRFQIGTSSGNAVDWRVWQRCGDASEFDVPAQYRNVSNLYLHAFSANGLDSYICVRYQGAGIKHFDFDADEDHQMNVGDRDSECP